MAELVPVDHDPFSGPKTVPIDYDPFAAEKFANPAVKGMIGGMTSLPQRAIESAATYQQTGEYDPAPILEAATLPMGTGAIVGLPVRAGETALGAGLMRKVDELGRGRSGRPLVSEKLPEHGPALAEDAEIVGIEGAGAVHILQDGLGRIRGIYGSKFAADNAHQRKMREAWENHGPTYGDKYDGAPPAEHNRILKEWNRGRSRDERMTLDDITWTKDDRGQHWLGPIRNEPDLIRQIEAVDLEWMEKSLPYRNAKAAAKWFEENVTEEEDFAHVLYLKPGNLRGEP